MHFNLPDEVLEIFNKIENSGYEIYLVGGAVRDLLMGRLVDDWDFTTSATPEEILKIFPGAFYDNKFGTVGIESKEGYEPHEITTFRTECGYSDKRHPDKISWGKTLEEDLQRRDFTINAIALKFEARNSKFEIIDPYEGQKNIKNKLIGAVGNPNERFSEDALRMMRAIRIATELGFLVEEKTFEAIQKNVTLIDKIAKERIKEELFKILASTNPYEGVLLFRKSGLMQRLIPELEKTFGVEQKSPGRHHIYDVGTHLMLSLKECNSTDPITRFATLIHDIGKPQTFKKLPNGTITFYNHEMVGTNIAKDIALRLRFSRKEADKFITLVRWHQFSVGEMQTDSAIRRFIRNVGKDNINDMLVLRVADRVGSGSKATSWRLDDFKRRLVEVQKEPFSVRDLKIDGNDVMKVLRLRSGPKVGEVLNKLFEEVVEKNVENEREILFKRLREIS